MTVPLYFNETGKKDIEEAAKLSGMQIIKFVDESVAAAYAYGLDKNEKVKNVLVFNFGGSVFSLSYLVKNIKEVQNKTESKEKSLIKIKLADEIINKNIEFEVKHYNCDYFLGGEV